MLIQLKLTTESGQRKYLTASERTAFINATKQVAPISRTLCLMLAHTGCLISEAINIRYRDIDLSEYRVAIRTLRKRSKKRSGTFRNVPLPGFFVNDLVFVHRLDYQNTGLSDAKLWDWSRKNAFDKVKRVMKIAGIEGYHATPTGIRHTFGVHCAKNDIPLTYIQKWMGHSSLEYTEIYLLNRANDERAMAERLWS